MDKNQLQIEKNVIYWLLSGERQNIKMLEENDFYYIDSKKIYLYILKNPECSSLSISDNIGIDIVKLSDYMAMDISNSGCFLSFVDLVNSSLVREMKTGDLKKIQKIQKRLSEIYSPEIEDNSMFHLMESFNENRKKKGFKTGNSYLDDITMRLKKCHFWVLGGYSNTGKTQFAVELACNAISDGANVLFLSIEMTEPDLMEKFYRNIELRKGENTAQDFFIKYQKNLYVTSKVYSIDQIEAYIGQRQYDVVFIDYIQLIEDNSGKSEYEKMTNIAHRLARIAKEKNVCIVALSQVSEERQKTNGNSTMGFKGSGGIGSATDVGIILRRDFDNEGAADIVDVACIIRKNRYGRQATIPIQFDKSNGLYL